MYEVHDSYCNLVNHIIYLVQLTIVSVIEYWRLTILRGVKTLLYIRKVAHSFAE